MGETESGGEEKALNQSSRLKDVAHSAAANIQESQGQKASEKEKEMNPVIISCKANDWQNVAASNLRDGIEVDLVDFNYSFDVEDCNKLAVANGMTFSFKPETSFGFFRKRKSS